MYCKHGRNLGAFVPDVINAVVIELQDQDTYSEVDPLKIIIFGDEEPKYDDTKDIEKHIGEPIIVKGDAFLVPSGRSSSNNRMMITYLYVK